MKHKRSERQSRALHRIAVVLLSMLLLLSLLVPAQSFAAESGAESVVTSEGLDGESTPAPAVPDRAQSVATETDPASEADSVTESTPSESKPTGTEADRPAVTEEQTESVPETIDLDEETVEEVVAGAITGPTTVQVGQTITLTSDQGSYSNRWTTSNSSVATVSGNWQTATVRGISAGQATITHRYKNSWRDWEWSEETTVVTVTAAPQTRTFTFNPKLSNASVRIFHYYGNLQGLEDSGELTDNTPYSFTCNTTQISYFVILAKPDENYLLTGLNADGQGEFYSTQASSFGSINSYPGIHSLVDQYKDDYVAVFGYQRAADTNGENIAFELVGKSPSIAVTAVANPSQNLSPGQEVQLTLTVTPGQISGKAATINSVKIENLKVNGAVQIESQTLTRDSQGRYRTTFAYTITEADCANATLPITVDGEVQYEFSLGASSGQSVRTTADIRSSAETSIRIADYRTAHYSYTWDETQAHDHLTFPELPVDEAKYYFGRGYFVPIQPITPTVVEDEVNHGTWTFEGWTRQGIPVSNTIFLSSDDAQPLQFIGNWRFEQTTMSVTVHKTVAGNMGDRTKTFDFTASVNGSELSGFSLAHGGSTTLADLPIGSVLSLAENHGKYSVLVKYGSSEEDAQTVDPSAITLEAGKDQIYVTNTYDVDVVTGINLDSLPFVLLLLFTGAAALLFVLTAGRRRLR